MPQPTVFAVSAPHDAAPPATAIGTVVAVSTASPQWVEINGVPTHTSIVRDPSPVPLHFGAQGPEGNALALHTETVYAFPLEHYDYWSQQLGVDRASWGLCRWGENLTVTGLFEDDLKIGDRLHFSGGAVLEVTGARTPCGKLSWRLGVPSTALKTMTSKGWLGIYLRVIVAGMIGAGETIAVASPYPGNLTVGELGRLLDRGMAADPAALEAAAAMPAISQQNQEQLLNTADHMRDMVRATTGRWQGWRQFVVADRRVETDDVVTVRFEPTDGQPVALYRGGQFVSVRIPGPDCELIRTWSLSRYEDDPSGYTITVRRVAGGIGSAWLHGLALGDTVDLRPPSGRFVVERSGIRPVMMLSAGIGVTPVLAMMQAHARHRQPTPLEWVHIARSSAHHILGKEAEDTLASHPDFTRHLFYSRPEAEDVRGRDYDHDGRLTKEALATILDRPITYRLAGREIEVNGRTKEFYVCGPAGFEADVKAWLLELGVLPHLIRSETFDARPGMAFAGDTSRAAIRFARSGVSAEWTEEHPASLLEVAEGVGLTPDYGCRNGSCGSCETRILSGKVTHSPAPAFNLGADRALLCCAYPDSETVTLDV